jgi:hypothetical protein
MAKWDAPIANVNNQSIKEIWNGEALRNIRNVMLSGGEPEPCSRCYLLEKTTKTSTRMLSNRKFKHLIKEAKNITKSNGAVTQMKLAYWDFRFSNICNLKCRMCGDQLSSAWYEDVIQLKKLEYGIDHKRNNHSGIIRITNSSSKDLWKTIQSNINYVEEIYFAGGEPLIMDEHYLILQQLIEKGKTNVRLVYNTNISKFTHKKYNVINYWKQFKTVVVCCSIDAPDVVGEYIRRGSNWNVVVTNLSLLMTLPNVDISITPTIQIHNLLEIPVLVDAMLHLGLPPKSIILSNILTSPHWYDIRILPDNIKTIAKRNLIKHLTTLNKNERRHIKKQYTGILTFLKNSNTNTKSLMMLKDQTLMLDTIRNDSYKCLNEELVKLLDTL